MRPTSKLVALAVATLSSLSLTPYVANAQGPISSGETVTGTIAPVGDVDSWTFTAIAGDAIVARVGEISQSGNFTPRVRLYSPGGAQLDIAWSGEAAEVVATAAVTGTYRVDVDDQAGTSATGTYRLTLAKTGSTVFVSPGDEGGPLANGAIHTGTIDTGDLDVWTVSATAGEAIVARMGEIVAGSAVTPQLRIYSPGGTQMDIASSGAAAEVVATATITGTHLVVAGDFSSGMAGTGTYRLTLAKTGSTVFVSPGDSGGPMANGAIHTGTIDTGDLDVWTVSATAGEAIVVRMGEIVAGSAVTPQLRIYSPGGTQMDIAWGGAAAEVVATATITGTHLVVAGDFSSGLAGTGTYRLTLAKTGSTVFVSPGDSGGPLTNGAIHTGTIDTGDLDVWTVSANAGEAIVVRMGETVGGSPLSPQLRIYSPGGTQIDIASSGAAAEVVATATITGTHLVVAGDFSSGLAGTGTYRLTLAKTGSTVFVSPGDEGGPLSNGVIHTGTIDVGDLDVWTLSAIAGGAIDVAMSEIAAHGVLTPQLRLYSPTGAQLDISWGVESAQVTATAPVTGTYLLVAGDFSSGLAQSGPYRLWITGTVDVAPNPLALDLQLSPGMPNPFAARTILRYRIPRAAPTTLRVFDAQGRVVRTLVDERLLPPGAHEATWDGRDAGGNQVAPGVYLARLDSDGRPVKRKLTLMP